MRRIGAIAFWALLVVAPATCLAEGNVNFIIGPRALDDGVWEAAGLDEQVAFGAVFDFAGEDWPVHLAAGLHVSSESEEDVTGEVEVGIVDASFGVLWIAQPRSAFNPYLGAGVAVVGVAVDDDDDLFDFDDDDETDRSFGVYANAGLSWRLGERVNVGLDARILRGTEVDIDLIETDVDYAQYGLRVGFGW